MVSDLDPAGARCSAEYVLCLRRRREAAGLTYRQLARRARATRESLPPSTVATMLHRNTLPSRDLVAAYIRACGGDDGEVATWLDARSRLAMAAVPAPFVDGSRAAGGAPARSRGPVREADAGGSTVDGTAVRPATGGDVTRLLALRRRLEAQPDPGGPGFHVVADPGGDEPLAGYARVEVDPHWLTGRLVLGVDARWRGRGIGTRLARAAVDECRRRGLRRVELTAATHHQAAVRLLLACGFQIEGLRRASLVVDGRDVDEYYLGLLLA
ncbi:GNAT family N-acetyltransferase [Phytohabitans houttuyneae]|uniref:N-acetyltransferase domain-containing protein n=1 Tax=Phytohabitans houttuyneae TaxID=1076126 RepID=A0A6V8KPV6_9ACTN|nr:GNAT family N-acetyltransferase [Phytohabitans houttuyneae]GFJ84259.1 hypothetical protein Phou_084390 [Phytohabitans houttuyneae]